MRKLLNRLFSQQVLSREESKDVMIRMAAGEYTEAQIAAFISIYIMRSITIEEFMGFTDALLDLCVDVEALQAYNPIDIVGMGGDNKNTFNISTLSCFVVAGAGYKVAKHGNFGSTSVSGASNVMEQHGIKFTADVSRLERSLAETNMAYLHAPLFNNALKIVAPVRKSLGVRTFFNMLGPVVNPIKPKRSVLGVFNLKMARMYYYMYQKMDVDYTILHGLDGYDEISLTGDFKIIDKSGEAIYSPKDLGFLRHPEAALDGGSTLTDAAKIFDNVINNTATVAQKDAVVVNSAFAIRTIDPTRSIDDCIAEARESIDSGKAKRTFEQFLKINS